MKNIVIVYLLMQSFCMVASILPVKNIRNNEELLKLINSARFQNLPQGQFDRLLEEFLWVKRNDNVARNILNKLITSSQFNNVDISTFARCVYHFAYIEDMTLLEKMIRDSRFDKLSEWDFFRVLDSFAGNGREYIVKRLMQDPRFSLADKHRYSSFLCRVAQGGLIEIFEQLMQNKFFKELSVAWTDSDGGLPYRTILYYAVLGGNYEIVKKLLQDPRFDTLVKDYSSNFNRFVDEVINKGNKQIAYVLFSKLFKDYPELFNRVEAEVNKKGNKQLVHLLKELVNKKGNKHLVHLLKALTALKPEHELVDLTPLDNELIKAYRKFCTGDPNDLYNLIFPVVAFNADKPFRKNPEDRFSANVLMISPSDFGYAVSLLSEKLFKLFKQDSIKSLIITLAQDHKDVEYALYLMSQMNLADPRDVAKVSNIISTPSQKALQALRVAERHESSQDENTFKALRLARMLVGS